MRESNTDAAGILLSFSGCSAGWQSRTHGCRGFCSVPGWVLAGVWSHVPGISRLLRWTHVCLKDDLWEVTHTRHSDTIKGVHERQHGHVSDMYLGCDEPLQIHSRSCCWQCWKDRVPSPAPNVGAALTYAYIKRPRTPWLDAPFNGLEHSSQKQQVFVSLCVNGFNYILLTCVKAPGLKSHVVTGRGQTSTCEYSKCQHREPIWSSAQHSQRTKMSKPWCYGSQSLATISRASASVCYSSIKLFEICLAVLSSPPLSYPATL